MHLGIIPDGNRRFGRESFKDGHFEGMKNILRTILWFTKNEELTELTIFCFSEENWKRSKDEIDYLMQLFEVILVEAIYFLNHGLFSKEARILLSDEVLLSDEGDFKEEKDKSSSVFVNVAITDEDKIPQNIKQKIKDLLENNCSKSLKYNKNKNKILNLCVSYTGQREIYLAVKKVIENGKDVNIKNIESELLIKGSPDLIIRTSGEKRLSGFLSWQSSYSEFMFLDKHWPEIETQDLSECILNYKKRERRFGK